MNGWMDRFVGLLVVRYLRGEWWVDVYVGSWEVDWVIMYAGWLIFCLVNWLFNWLGGWLCGCEDV